MESVCAVQWMHKIIVVMLVHTHTHNHVRKENDTPLIIVLMKYGTMAWQRICFHQLINATIPNRVCVRFVLFTFFDTPCDVVDDHSVCSYHCCRCRRQSQRPMGKCLFTCAVLHLSLCACGFRGVSMAFFFGFVCVCVCFVHRSAVIPFSRSVCIFCRCRYANGPCTVHNANEHISTWAMRLSVIAKSRMCAVK